jgi:hypothetical protein
MPENTVVPDINNDLATQASSNVDIKLVYPVIPLYEV